MLCVLAVASICVPWANLDLNITGSSIARVATFKSEKAQVEIWLGSDDIPYEDWASAPKVCVQSRCIAYRRYDDPEGAPGETTIIFCKAGEDLPERLVIRAADAAVRNNLLDNLELIPPYMTLSDGVALSKFNNTTPVHATREQRLHGDGSCP